MRRRATVVAGLGLATILTLGTGSVLAFAYGGDDGSRGGSKLRAEAVIEGAPGSGIVGKVTFVQTGGEEDQPTPAVRVRAEVSGLSPGLHGFHLHENGACAPAYSAAGGHYDPGPFGNSDPDANHPYHMGDLPNLVAGESGVGRLNAVTTRATLSPGPTTLFDANGSAVIVHLNPDQGITGPSGSGVSGGPRVACGVIEMD
jgi:Cu-Zn family superoxide dismutase